MRKTCLECTAKHLGSAAVYIDEIRMGYPNYYGYAYGELNHAASECMADFPALACVIREHRIRWSTTREDERPHRIPFESLFGYIAAVEKADGANIVMPDEVYAGLERDIEGNVIFSMDTRP